MFFATRTLIHPRSCLVCLGAALGLAALCVSPAWATDPFRTAVVVNARSLDSLTLANHYAQLREIPDRCVVVLSDVPEPMSCSLEEMRTFILDPLLKELDQRGLGNQVDIIAYSAGFPTAITLDQSLAKIPNRHQIFTPVGSLNGLTYLYQFLKSDPPTYVSPRVNFYARPDAELLLQNPFLGGDAASYAAATATATADTIEDNSPKAEDPPDDANQSDVDESDTNAAGANAVQPNTSAGSAAGSAAESNTAGPAPASAPSTTAESAPKEQDDAPEDPIATMQSLATKHPGQWPLRWQLAILQAKRGLNEAALATLAGLARERAIHQGLLDQEGAFDSLREQEPFKKLRESVSPKHVARMPPLPFSARIAWGRNGLPLAGNEGPRYVLSTMLAVTSGRGTTLPEAIEILKRAATADGTGQPATFYFSNSADVRAKTRLPLVPLAAVTLRELGHEVIIDSKSLPQGQEKLMGAMLGTAVYDWPLAANRLLPGAIADNLTSTSGVLHAETDQTSMVELLRGGAAGTSGTVTEPYALQFKFPTPLMYAYYALGATLAEAFYLSVESPYQLLIVGDPLCRPYGDEYNEAFTLQLGRDSQEQLELGLQYWRPFPVAAQKVARVELFFDGKLALIAPPSQVMRISKTGMTAGWHTLSLSSVSRHPLQMKVWDTLEVLVGEESACPVLTAKHVAIAEPEVGADEDYLELAVQVDGADRVAIEHFSRRIAESTETQKTFKVPVKVVGRGPVRLVPLALRDGKWISGKPVVIEVGQPIADARPSRQDVIE